MPTGGNIEPEDEVVFTDEHWFFVFVDNDAPLSELSLENQDQVMYAPEINPTMVGEKDYNTGLGSFTISEFGFEFTIGFEIREQ